MNDPTAHSDESNGESVVRSVLDRRREFDASVDCDALIGAVSDRRRRCLLYLLAEEPVESVENLAVYVREIELAVHDRWDPDLHRENVLVSLVHHHVPVLEEAGIVTFDGETGEVSRGKRFSDTIDLLDGMFRRPPEREI